MSEDYLARTRPKTRIKIFLITFKQKGRLHLIPAQSGAQRGRGSPRHGPPPHPAGRGPQGGRGPRGRRGGRVAEWEFGVGQPLTCAGTELCNIPAC